MTNRSLVQSIGAVLLGLGAVILLSLGTDQVLRALKVYPPSNQPIYGTGLLFLAFIYRSAYAVVGSYIAARLAPSDPMRHALALGIIGLVLSLGGVIVAFTVADIGPKWYPIALVLDALPCAWLGGFLRAKI